MLALSSFCAVLFVCNFCVLSGHPDNVAPAIYGGIQLGIHTGERWMTERVNTPPGIQVDIFLCLYVHRGGGRGLRRHACDAHVLGRVCGVSCVGFT